MRVCPACGDWRGSPNASGESSLYSPNRKFTLCEPCWLEEDEMIEETGGNDHPEIIARYAKAEGRS